MTDAPADAPPARPGDPSAIELLAASAHEFWRMRMQREGWRAGPPGSYDESARVHEALVPFEQLSHEDRWIAIESVEALHLEEQLAESIEYPRGPARPLRACEMHVGLRVESSLEPLHAGDAPARGQVVGWDVDPRSSLLSLIHVRWDDGAVTSHCPLERELRAIS